MEIPGYRLSKGSMHNDWRWLEYQECCGAECDGENGKLLVDNNKNYFEKYKIVTDYQGYVSIQNENYPLYIEGYFVWCIVWILTGRRNRDISLNRIISDYLLYIINCK